MTPDSFSNLNLPAGQLDNLASLGYLHMTPIQAAALPGALKGDDLIAQAKTGSGKTAVFALALLARLDVAAMHTQALILCPTRELSIQVATEVRRLARWRQNIKVTTLYGGQPISLQKQSLKHGTHIVVGTPGRIKDHLEKKTLALDHVRTLVLDEADRMLEMGFSTDLDAIVAATPATRQTLLFSATFPDNIKALSARFQRQPAHVRVDEHHRPSDIRQHVYLCAPDEKPAALAALLAQYQPASCLVFCNLKQTTHAVCDALAELGYSVAALNGDLEQRDREEILIRFKHQSCSVLVATDVAARGLDIKELPAVINYDLPPDPEIYVHRIGRTGRAGSTGIALSLCAGHERARVAALGEFQHTTLDCEPIRTRTAKAHRPPPPANITLCISGGRKDKIRPGEILGTLTGDNGIAGKDVGKIDILDYASYVAITRAAAPAALHKLQTTKLKSRTFKIREL